MRVVVSQNSLRSDNCGSLITLNFSFEETDLSIFSAFRKSLFLLKGPMLLKWMHWYEDTSARVKPCFCVGVFGGGTVHLFRVLSEVLYCLVFSNSGNSFRYWWRHVTLSHRKPLTVILNWFPCLIRCSVRSSGRLLIAHAIVSLVPLLHFHGIRICSCVSWRWFPHRSPG